MLLAIVSAMAPTPAPSPAGPCGQGALASISDRPGLGRAPATNGAACVVLPRQIVIEAGYRNQVTAGSATQILTVYPSPIVRVGLRGQNEIVISPSLLYSRRTGAPQVQVNGFLPATGMQDAGFGFKHLLQDRTAMQDAVNLFVTLPTGYPGGANGFTAGLATYTLGYSAVFALSGRVGLSTTQNFILNAALQPSGASQRYFTFQPAFSASYALSPNLSLLLQDQLAISTPPAAGTGNRALSGIQASISPNVVLDAEFEANLLIAPGLTQHAVGVGVSVLP